MREIIFRGKNVDNGAWVYGSLLIQAGERINKYELTPAEYRILGCRGENHLVAPETVGQFTGLTDKNGTKIFEGDIIQDSNYPEYVFRIEYHNGTIIASEIHTFDKVYLDNFICFNIFEAFVIGNIHDNPELLNK